MTEIDGVELLRSIFGVVIIKAERDQAFARELLAAIPAGAHLVLPPKSKIGKKREKVDFAKIHPANLIQSNREDFLRSQLKILNRDELRQLAGLHEFRIVGRSRQNKGQLLESIVGAARNRVANMDGQAVRTNT